ncbi:NADP(H)-dependent aldo-keto reductase [Spongiibacter taiwanensis]|uniref:NADP(H)-dependent aldo-keto reductase n=1 Tax=Spongiibacter taiwanensis TaxID=1748242 RepID=UPI0020353F14|nr:NADP(H)-dependent aldo-keto reductase [Spongiibacter taiwanensis]USA42181.1 NADP(H)-dependent aldo-keto reductase [Spongiibacter taiwanensis]
MKYRTLGTSQISVSELCLGTMTWGEQNTQEQAFEQLDYALSRGINFIDTAEMYPVPPKASTQGQTEIILGEWFRQCGRRADVVLATKAAGPGHAHIRDGKGLNRDAVLRAIEGNLARLQTDHIDLYQIHWPNRSANFFGQLGYTHADGGDAEAELHDILGALAELVAQGVVNQVGISNETPWGLMTYLRLAAQYDLPRVASIQNPYNLLNRTFEIGLAEMAIREKVGLLAYSPMAFGVLSGKYRHGQRPADGRITLFERFQRYAKPEAVAATEQYCQLAERHQLDPAQLALAFVTRQPFVTSNIIGATTMDQLKANIDSADLVLSDEVLAEINTIHQAQPNPAP